MLAIAYVSSAAAPLGDADLARIVETSRVANAASGITGVLLYCDGNFMHYLEGAEDAVVHTFARIRRSGLHRHVNELMNLHIVEREFPDWYMGFSRTSATEFLAVAAARWKGSAQTGPGAGLLRSFWSSCRVRLD